MKLIAPDYYPGFHCIAGSCRHSCCIGWEIDIDGETLARYRRVPGKFGRRLAEHIDITEECASFRLDEHERCPFLNSGGLCDIILYLGEDALSQICTDHPRFRAFFSDRTEIGLGLCCEAAAALILRREEPVRLITLTDDGAAESLTAWERLLLAERDRRIALAQDRALSAETRMAKLCHLPERSFDEWTGIYLSLEQMDPAWSVLLRRARESTVRAAVPETLREQLLVYFLYRHLSHAEDRRELDARTAFAVLSEQMITALIARQPGESPEEIARLYSSEIEYSEENTEALIELLGE